MLRYLQDWLTTKAGRAPVLVATIPGVGSVPYVMTDVDGTGVVLENDTTNSIPVAFPWASIRTIAPNPNG